MASSKEPTREDRRIEDVKDAGSFMSGGSEAVAPAGIDAEVAQFFSAQAREPVIIDEATNVRLRWMVHRRVLVVMVVTYCEAHSFHLILVPMKIYGSFLVAQTLDKGYVNRHVTRKNSDFICNRTLNFASIMGMPFCHDSGTRLTSF